MDLFKQTMIFILRLQSQLVLKKYKPKVVVITGGVGKTSTKNAVYAVLSRFFFVRKSEKIYDNRIGFPLTILGVTHGKRNFLSWVSAALRGCSLIFFPSKYPQWLVLEATTRKPGRMRQIVSWIRTDFVVITPFGKTPAHLEFFPSVEALIAEKSLIINTLKRDGVLMLNFDESKVRDLKAKTKTKVASFGFDPHAMIKTSNQDFLYKDDRVEGIMFRVNYDGKSVPITIKGALGKNHVYAALAALGIAREVGVNMIEAARGLENYEIPPGRMRLITGIKDTIIIDDSYNSSPLAAESALYNLKEVKAAGLPAQAGLPADLPAEASAQAGVSAQAGKKFAVLGDMLELGKYTDEAHKQIGELAAKSADFLITVGVRARMIAAGALIGGMNERDIFQFEEAREAGKFVEKKLAAGDVVLIKGSRDMRMERAVEEIMLHPENKERLLCRQTSEWK